MKTFQRTKENASALVVTLLVIFLITVFVGVAAQLTTATVRQTDSSRDFSALRSAAEGALDLGYGVWTKSINNYYKPVSKNQLGTLTTPSFSNSDKVNGVAFTPEASTYGPLQVNATNEYGQPLASSSATPSPIKITLDNYPGWAGFNSGYVASVRLTGTFGGHGPVTYGVKRAMNYAVVPLFQATAFFEDNLELYKTAPMTITGLVHTNSHAYVSQPSPGTLAFGDATHPTFLSHVGGYTDGSWVDSLGVTRDAPPEAWTWSGYTPNSSQTPDYFNGIEQGVHQVNRMEPLGADSTTILHPPKDANGNIIDTNPNDDSMRELIEPPVSGPVDPQQIADRRLYNKAGIRVHIVGSTYTVSVANGTSLTARQITALKGALSQQTVFDKREGKDIDLTTLDIAKAKATITSGGPNEPGPLEVSSFNNILYIDQTKSDGTIDTSDPKGIRLKNGSNLPTEGLTVASQNPVYIQGDYNSSASRPSSAVFADAVTILSNNWDDNKDDKKLSDRDATNTTVNTAIVAGFLPSGWKNPDGDIYGYSGGLNNFPRFLEDWTNKTFTYKGSMIELFTSQVAIGEWRTDPNYLPPNRAWSFDDKFIDTPPPGSLTAISLGRGALTRF